jgi:hypothetical protein
MPLEEALRQKKKKKARAIKSQDTWKLFNIAALKISDRLDFINRPDGIVARETKMVYYKPKLMFA